MRHKPLLLVILIALFISFGSCAQSAAPAFSETARSSEATEAAEVEPASVWIDLESVQNIRQLGGYPAGTGRFVKQNVLLRAGELALLTDADKELLASVYNVTQIIDLRDEVEVQDASDAGIDGAQYHNFIVWPRAVRTRIIQESTTEEGFDSELYIENYYTSFALEPDAIEAYKMMFEILLENEDGSVLIHCVHGKDRTGIAVALILSALQVEWHVIEEEHLLSNAAFADSVDVSSLRHYKSVIEENYGSIENYLKVEMNLDEDDLAVLREKYTVLI